MNITDQLIKMLRARKEKLMFVSPQTINNWERGKHSPLLRNVDLLCQENDIEVLIYNGDLDDIINFAHRVAQKKGMKLVLSFDV